MAIGVVGTLALALFRWYLKQHSAQAKKKEKAYENVANKIDSNAPVGDVQSGIDDLLNRL